MRSQKSEVSVEMLRSRYRLSPSGSDSATIMPSGAAEVAESIYVLVLCHLVNEFSTTFSQV